MLSLTIKGKARRREGEGKGGRRSAERRSRFFLFFIENEEDREWPTVLVI